MSLFHHIVLTKFNLKRPEFVMDRRGDPVQTDEWMAHRIRLFETYCFPSMRDQGRQNFTWLVLFDRDTPARYGDLIKKYEAYDRFTPRFLAAPAANPAVLACIREAAAPDCDFLITTRIDNDDAFRADAIEVIQSQFSGQSFEFINLPEGAIVKAEQAFIVREPSNPFMTLIEKRAGRPFQTVYMDGHHRLGRHGPIRQVPGGPYWLRVIHERNMLNEAEGLPCSPRGLEFLFPFLKARVRL